MMFERFGSWDWPAVVRRVRPVSTWFDRTLLYTLTVLLCLSLLTMYSAAYDFPGRFEGHLRNVGVALLVMVLATALPPNALQRLAVPLYVVGLTLLIAVALFGVVNKGARRWLDLGVTRIQPSEMLKLAVPLLLAWYFHQRESSLAWRDFLIAGVLLLIPVILIAKQPDLGTAILVLGAGSFVIIFAGLSGRVMAAILGLGVAALPVFWTLMHDYQRQRVLTLLDPSTDPLGKGFHIIQSVIAIGSGGVTGKGWLQGTQTHLEFIPERTTDFILAVLAEEFGLVGVLGLMTLYLFWIGRGLVIAAQGSTPFARLLAAALTMSFFTYCFVNIGMVIGVLPVVGVPLPWMSYGGTAMVTLGLGAGIVMSVHRHRTLVQH